MRIRLLFTEYSHADSLSQGERQGCAIPYALIQGQVVADVPASCAAPKCLFFIGYFEVFC